MPDIANESFRAVQQAVARALPEGFANAAQHWQPLSGGRTNQIWRVGAADDEALVVKLYDPSGGNILFPNDPEAEALALAALSGSGTAPEPVVVTRAAPGRVIVYRFVPGQSPGTDDAAVGAALARIHATPPPPALRRIAPGQAAILSTGGALLDECAGPAARQLRALCPPVIATAAAPAVFLHGDAVPGNVVVGRRGAVFIDWQCPAIGDAVEDLSAWLSPAMQWIYAGRRIDAAARGAFLAGYGAAGAEARLDRMAPALHWRMAAYCLRKAQRGDPAYRAGFELELAQLQELGEREGAQHGGGAD